MPAYKKKITRLMDYPEFKEKTHWLPIAKRAFLSLLFFAGCRISEALAITSDHISYSNDTIYIEFFRLKGSEQTDPQQLPLAGSLKWLCYQKGILFPFTRTTAYRLVKSCFPNLYPHYFRMNRITHTLEKHGVSAVKHTFGLSLSSIDHYIGKVDIKRVGKALHKEIS